MDFAEIAMILFVAIFATILLISWVFGKSESGTADRYTSEDYFGGDE